MRSTYIAITLLLVALWLGCSRDTFVEDTVECDEIITYEEHMIPVIELNCAYDGCHNGSDPTISNYVTYNGVKDDFPEMFNRVVTLASDDLLGMPRDGASGPNDLSDEDFRLFSCWIEQEFPEN